MGVTEFIISECNRYIVSVIQSVKDALMEYDRDLMNVLTKPAKVNKSAKKGLLHAFGYFTLTLLLFTAIAGALEGVKILWEMQENNFMGELSDALPDFRIQDGMFTYLGDEPQPYYVTPNFVIDTTGVVTEPPVDKRGEGMLITKYELIQAQSYKTEVIKFSDLEGIVKNKQDLIKFMGTLVNIMMPVMVLIVYVFKVIGYAVYCAVVIVGLTSAGLIYANVKKSNIPPAAIAAIAFYVQTPILLMSVPETLTPGMLYIPVALIGLLWACAVFFIAITKDYALAE